MGCYPIVEFKMVLIQPVLCLDREFYCTDVFEFLQKNTIQHIVPVVKKGKKMNQIMKGKKAWCEHYVMNGHKKKIRLDIVIDIKYLKGKREKKRCVKTSGLWFLVSNSLQERSVLFIEDLL